MFVKSTIEVGITQRVVATLVACAVVMATVGIYNTAQAANLLDVSNTLTDSTPGVTSGHSISFVVPTGSSIAPGDDITLTFDSQDDGAVGQSFAGIASVVGGNVTVSGGGAFDSSTADTIVVNGVTAAAGNTVTIDVADLVITNPAKQAAAGIGDSYEIEIAVGNATNDIGRTRVVIVDNVTVSAIVATTFDFVVTGLDAGGTVNGETLTGTSTPLLIPFGEIAADTEYAIGQQLNVTTNAANGFVVTVQTDQQLTSSNGSDIDSFRDATDVTVPEAWAPPADTLNDENTYGHWGLTTADTTLESGVNFAPGAVPGYVAANTVPTQIFSHDNVTDGTGAGQGQTEVAYKIEITPLQEAGDDYTATLMYIATPTF